MIAILTVSGCAGFGSNNPTPPSASAEALTPHARPSGSGPEGRASVAPGDGEALPDPISSPDHAPGESVRLGEALVTYEGLQAAGSGYVARFRVVGDATPDEVILMPWATRLATVMTPTGFVTTPFVVPGARTAARIVVFIGAEGASWRLTDE